MCELVGTSMDVYVTMNKKNRTTVPNTYVNITQSFLFLGTFVIVMKYRYFINCNRYKLS